MGFFDWIRGVSEGAGEAGEGPDSPYRCVNCGSDLEQNYKACPDCGSEFVAAMDPDDEADGPDEGTN